MKKILVMLLAATFFTACQNDILYRPGDGQKGQNGWKPGDNTVNDENTNTDLERIPPFEEGEGRLDDDSILNEGETNYRQVKRYNKFVLFSYDSAVIGTAYEGFLDEMSTFLITNPSYRLTIEGHCDVRGTEKYNRALSERRALAVKTYMLGRSVGEGSLTTVAFGEDKLRSSGTASADHAQNRRAAFVLSEKIVK